MWYCGVRSILIALWWCTMSEAWTASCTTKYKPTRSTRILTLWQGTNLASPQRKVKLRKLNDKKKQDKHQMLWYVVGLLLGHCEQCIENAFMLGTFSK
jgi:hypothetical protein